MEPPVGDDPGEPELTGPERRILGCLIEKERATPQNYPLTLNALRLACNQSTNRDPVTAYDETTLSEALSSLRQRNLTRIVYSTSNRAAKYRHILGEAWRLDDEELAVLALLLLRGPQTVGELKGRSDRLVDLADLTAVQATLERLAARAAGPLVVRLDRRPGQKDHRWAHLLGGPVEQAAPGDVVTPVDGGADLGGPTGPSGWDGHGGAPGGEVTELRREVDGLREELAALRADFERFRAEFG